MALLSDSLLSMKNDVIEKSVGTCVMAFHELILCHQGKDAKMESTLTIEELNKSQESKKSRKLVYLRKICV